MRHARKILAALPLLAAAAFWSGTAIAESTETVATIEGRAITRAQLEAHVSQQLKQLDMQRHQALESGLESLIETQLIERAAKASGASAQAYLDAEVHSKVAVNDAEIDAFYNANKARLGGQPKEQVAPRLRAYLEQQAALKKRSELVQELKKRFPVAVALEPWRVDLGSTKGVPSRGGTDAPVKLTLFSDFQCPGCRSIEPLLDEVRETYGDRLQIQFRQFPLTSIHPEAFKAAEAALCAGDQGRFWDMHASLFADQRRLDRAALGERAKELKLEIDAFETCLDGGAKSALVERDLRLGREAGVTGTPSIYINGRPVQLTSADKLSSVIDDELSRLGS